MESIIDWTTVGLFLFGLAFSIYKGYYIEFGHGYSKPKNIDYVQLGIGIGMSVFGIILTILNSV